MIKSKKELLFYIQADSMMNKGYFRPRIKDRIKNCIKPDPISRYLKTLRRVEYYSNIGGGYSTFIKQNLRELVVS